VRFVAALDNCTDIAFEFVGLSGAVSSVESTLALLCVGSTGEWFCRLLGFLGFLLVAQVH